MYLTIANCILSSLKWYITCKMSTRGYYFIDVLKMQILKIHPVLRDVMRSKCLRKRLFTRAEDVFDIDKEETEAPELGDDDKCELFVAETAEWVLRAFLFKLTKLTRSSLSRNFKYSHLTWSESEHLLKRASHRSVRIVFVSCKGQLFVPSLYLR
jgi:hypothetical protein